jgi:hypothetical protein
VHDKPFLEGLARHGINRQDLIIADASLPFAAINQHYATLQKERREKKKIAAVNGEDMDDVVKQEEDGGEDPVEKAVKAAAFADHIDKPSSLIVVNGEDPMNLLLLDHVGGIISEHLSSVKAEEEKKVALVPETVMSGVTLPLTQDAKDIQRVTDVPLGGVLDNPIQNLAGVNVVEAGEAAATPVIGKALLSESSTVKSESPSIAPAQPISGSAHKDRKPTPPQEPEEFVWPKEAVVLRRVDHLIDIVMNPKPVVSKKRKMVAVVIPLINNGAGSPATDSSKKVLLDGDFGSDAGNRSDHGEETASAYSIPPSPNKKPAVGKKDKSVKKPKDQMRSEKDTEKEKGKKSKAAEVVQEKGKKDKKRKGQTEEDTRAENELVVPKKKRARTKALPAPLTTSASLVTISSETNGTGPDGSSSKQSGLKLLIKLKMPSIAPPVQATPSSDVKSKGKKPEAKVKPKSKPVKERPPHAAKPNGDEKIRPTKKPASERKKEGAESSGSDTDEMMAIASKQLEYLQRKIQEKRMKRTSSPQSSVRAGDKPPKAKTPSVGGSVQGNTSVAKPLATQYTQSPPPSHLDAGPRRSGPAQKPSAGRQRGRSTSRSSRSSFSSRSRSSRSSSSSGSSSSSSSRSSSSRSRSSSGSSSSSGSDSDSRRRRRDRGQQKRGRQRRSSGGSIRRRPRSLSRSRSRSPSRSSSRSLSRSRSRSMSRSRSRSRSLSRSRSRSESRSRSRSPHRPYSGYEKYRHPHLDSTAALSSASAIKQQQSTNPNVTQAHQDRTGSHYPNGVGSSYDSAPLAHQHQQQQQLTGMGGSKSNGKKRDNGGNGGSKRREGFMDDDQVGDDGYYHKKSRS